MAQKVHKVVIGGIEFKLTSEDEITLRKAVDIVNQELDSLNNQSEVKLPISQSYVLVSLNIAEKLIAVEKQLNQDKDYLKSELDKITELIDSKINH